MMKTKNLIVYEIASILLVFTIVYFISVNKVSYAFSYDDVKELQESKVKLINSSAKLYGEINCDLFEESDTIYVTVNDLVANGYLLPDDDKGNVKDPSGDVKLLNDTRIRITNKDGKIDVKILS